MLRIAFVTTIIVLTSGCTAVVNNTLDMKGDGGTGGCSIDEDCSDGNPCNGVEVCVSNGCRDTDSMPDGTPCMTGTVDGVCMGAMCVVPEGCGDGIVQDGPPFNEECDDGANAEEDDGCTPDCQYSCHDDAECDDLFECNGSEICSIPGPGGNIRRCQPGGALPPAGAQCDAGFGTENEMCVFPPSGEVYCCLFNDMGMPQECCRPDEDTPDPTDLICEMPPMP